MAVATHAAPFARAARFEANPAASDFHGNKRELLKRGLEAGKLTWAEIRAALPQQHMSDTELEVFLFTCRNMGIEVEGG